MNINVVNIDSTEYSNNKRIPVDSYALAKIRAYHTAKGDTIFNNLSPETIKEGDYKTYVSVIFTENKDKAKAYQKIPNVLIGGSGWNLTQTLPPEIEHVNPKINMGFITRGCNRSCPFCVVPEKEGRAHQDRTLKDIWDGKSNLVTLLDNNILFLPEIFEETCLTAQKHKLTIDFNQGLDFRFISPEIAKIIKQTKIKDIRLALDHHNLIPAFDRALNVLRTHKCRKDPRVYALLGFNTDPKDDLARLNYLKAVGCRPYAMLFPTVTNYKTCNHRLYQFYKDLASWANQPQFFYKQSFMEYCLTVTFRNIKSHHKQIIKNTKKIMEVQ